MHSAQCRPRIKEAPPGVQYVGGAVVIPTPNPPPPRLSDLDLCLQFVPVCSYLPTLNIWLRLKGEGRGVVIPEVLSLLRKLWGDGQVVYHERLGWRKSDDG